MRVGQETEEEEQMNKNKKKQNKKKNKTTYGPLFCLGQGVAS